MTLLGWVGLGVGAVALFWLSVVLRDWLKLRDVLKRMAEGGIRSVGLRHGGARSQELANYLDRIRERLEGLEARVLTERQNLEAILSSMVEGVVIVDQKQRVWLANDAVIRMFGIRSSPLGRSLLEVFGSHELEGIVERALQGHLPARIELENLSGGEKRSYEVYSGAIRQEAEKAVEAAVVVFHDITALRELEAVRKDFVVNVSHEFRSPLAIINGYLETLLDGGLGDEEFVQNALKVMSRNGQRLAHLLEDLLMLTRLEHRTQQLDVQPMNLRESVDRVVESLNPSIQEAGATVEVDWEEGADLGFGDSRRLEQVFANLLENSLKHGGNGPLKIQIKGCRAPDGGRELAFSDNGQGIPLEAQKHVFERFYRVSRDRSRSSGGSGLGLSIAKQIVRAHGGEISLESVPGEGTTFRVKLPPAPVGCEP